MKKRNNPICMPATESQEAAMAKMGAKRRKFVAL